MLRVFLQGLTSMTTNLNQQSPPLALMTTLWCNIEIISLMLPLEPCLYPLYLIDFPLSSASDKFSPPGTMSLSSAFDKSLPLCQQWQRYLSIWGAPPNRLSSYGASSCTSKTYKISIQNTLKKNSFWSINNSKSLEKIFKGFPWKLFCKDVCHLLFCAHILNSDVLFCNMFL